MELFLNLLWLSMALAALAVWRTRWSQQPQTERLAPWRQWTAFTSAAVLLFFAVSLTDALHADLILFDEASSGRRHSLRIDSHHDAAKQMVHSGGSSPAVLAAAPAPVFVSVSRLDTKQAAAPRSDYGTDSYLGRAPPAAFL